jgi:hypothetical protein
VLRALSSGFPFFAVDASHKLNASVGATAARLAVLSANPLPHRSKLFNSGLSVPNHMPPPNYCDGEDANEGRDVGLQFRVGAKTSIDQIEDCHRRQGPQKNIATATANARMRAGIQPKKNPNRTPYLTAQ